MPASREAVPSILEGRWRLPLDPRVCGGPLQTLQTLIQAGLGSSPNVGGSVVLAALPPLVERIRTLCRQTPGRDRDGSRKPAHHPRPSAAGPDAPATSSGHRRRAGRRPPRHPPRWPQPLTRRLPAGRDSSTAASGSSTRSAATCSLRSTSPTRRSRPLSSVPHRPAGTRTAPARTCWASSPEREAGCSSSSEDEAANSDSAHRARHPRRGS